MYCVVQVPQVEIPFLFLRCLFSVIKKIISVKSDFKDWPKKKKKKWSEVIRWSKGKALVPFKKDCQIICGTNVNKLRLKVPVAARILNLYAHLCFSFSVVPRRILASHDLACQV